MIANMRFLMLVIFSSNLCARSPARRGFSMRPSLTDSHRGHILHYNVFSVAAMMRLSWQTITATYDSCRYRNLGPVPCFLHRLLHDRFVKAVTTLSSFSGSL